MIPIDDRIKYYIGNTDGPFVEKPRFHKSGYDVPIAINLPTYRHQYQVIHPNTAYPLDVVRLAKHSTKPTLYFQCGDSPYTDWTWPLFVKIRDTRMKSSKGIICNLESPRHMGEIFKFEDTKWENKKSDWLWRGADTGRGVRLDFVNRFYKEYNVGFSEYVQDHKMHPESYTEELKKPKVTPRDILTHKYLPVVDGNDKSSSLGWIMASNSVPIMPVPRYHTWMCEPWLKPGVHYVEVKRNFSDLLEKIEWCKEHDEECLEIAENGKKFMLQFTNPLQEEYIERKLVEYVNKCDI